MIPVNIYSRVSNINTNIIQLTFKYICIYILKTLNNNFSEKMLFTNLLTIILKFKNKLKRNLKYNIVSIFHICIKNIFTITENSCYFNNIVLKNLQI